MIMQVAARQPFCYIFVMKIDEQYISPTVRKGLGLLSEINKRGYEAYIAGGAVRDLVIRQLDMMPESDLNMSEDSDVHDVDIATSMPVEDLRLAFRCDSNNGEAHGTILVHYEGLVFEVTQFRVDGDYSDGRHPDSVKFTDSFKEDCARRDFTINAMGLDKDLTVMDYFGGIDDLVFRILRAVGNPYTRFSEDSLRVIRGMRFAARFGLAVDNLTDMAMKHNINYVKNVAMERIHDELYKCAGYGPKPFARMIGYMDKYGFAEVFSSLGLCLDRQRLMVESLPISTNPDYVMATFICMLPEESMEFLRCTRKEIRMAGRIRNGVMDVMSGKFGTDNDRIVHSVELYASPWFSIVSALCKSINPHCTAITQDMLITCQRIVHFRKSEPEYGKQVMEEGIKGGPEFGKRLKELVREDYCRIRDEEGNMSYDRMPW
jgi:hypothetical protein